MRRIACPLTAVFFQTLLVFSGGLDAAPRVHDLQSVHARAKTHDPNLQAAARQRDAGREALPQGRAGLLPSLDLSGEYARERRWPGGQSLDGSFSPRSDNSQTFYRLSLSQPLVRFERWYEFKASRKQATRADIEYQQAFETFTLELVQAYLETLKAQSRKETVRSQLTAVRAQQRQARSRLEAGLTSRLDVLQAEAEQRRVRAELVRARGELRSRFRVLESLSGLSLSRLADLSESLSLREAELRSERRWTSLALQQNKEIQLSRLGEDITRFQTSRARSRHWPTLDLSVSASRDASDLQSGSGNAALPDAESDSVQISLQLNVPLYAGGRTSSEHREARATEARAREESIATVEQVKRGVGVAHRNLQSLRETIAAARLSLDAQKTTLDATERSYESGVQDTVDVVEAQRGVFDARREVNDTRVDYLLELTQLHAEAGQLDPEFIASTRQWLEET